VDALEEDPPQPPRHADRMPATIVMHRRRDMPAETATGPRRAGARA
jgi:hypothetical protein